MTRWRKFSNRTQLFSVECMFSTFFDVWSDIVSTFCWSDKLDKLQYITILPLFILVYPPLLISLCSGQNGLVWHNDHGHAVAQHCINGDSLSQWRRAKLDPHRVETPEPIVKKMARLITFRRRCPVPDFMQIRPWGLLGKCVKYILITHTLTRT